MTQISKREIAIKIYRIFETHSERRARDNFEKYDANPKNLDPVFRSIVKRSYVAAALVMNECAKVCDAVNEQDERDNGAAMTFGAGNAASQLRNLAGS